jgi:hypothetical protein
VGIQARPEERKDSSFSEEKEAKRLSPVGAGRNGRAGAQTGKSFLVLFFKKERLLTVASFE